MNDTTKPKATILDLDAILDTNMDTVETLPDFVTPPPGTYTLGIKECKTEKYEMKDTKQLASRIRLTYVIEESIEIANNEPPYPNGSLFSESFMGTEDGLKFFKKAAMNILAVTSFEGASMGDVMRELPGNSFKARVTIRMTKGPAGQTYENVQVRAFNPVVAAE